MDGLTAKVFRTYNASITLQQQLKELTNGMLSLGGGWGGDPNQMNDKNVLACHPFPH